MSTKTVRIGTRDSQLAILQTQLVCNAITARHPHIAFELVPMKTTGDKILNQTLDKVGGKGLFVKELDAALIHGHVDLCVHSLKDVPPQDNPELPLAALLQRGDPRDALILPQTQNFPAFTAQIGTSSLRRKLQLQSLFPNCTCTPVRGNILTRLSKADSGAYSALVLASAGLQRSGLAARISRIFSVQEMLPAAGQGILTIQARAQDHWPFLSDVHHPPTATAALAERSFVGTLGGNCSAPVAAYAQVNGNELKLTGLHAPAGDIFFTDTITGQTDKAEQLGEELAQRMKGRHNT